MTEEHQRQIVAALERMRKELGNTDQEAAFQSMPSPVLHSLTQALAPGMFRAFPALNTAEEFSKVIEKIRTPAGLSMFLLEQSDLTEQELKDLLKAFADLPRILKKAMESSAKQILPTGGAPKKLPERDKIAQIHNEIHERWKNDDDASLLEIKNEIAERERISVSTLQRRLREYKEQRKLQKTQDSDKMDV